MEPITLDNPNAINSRLGSTVFTLFFSSIAFASEMASISGTTGRTNWRARFNSIPAGTVPVMKLNLVEDFQTGIYDYNLMTSTFVAWIVSPANRKVSVYVPVASTSPVAVHVPETVVGPVNCPTAS